MHRIDSFGHASNMFTDGDPTTGTPATWVAAEWLNAIQEEIISVLVAAGVTPTKGVVTQLLASVVVKTGGTFTGNVNVSGATDKTFTVEATNNSAAAYVRVKGKESGGTLVHARLSADLNNGVVGTDSNHPMEMRTNGTQRLAINGAGKLTAMPIGFESAEQTVTAASVLTVAHGLGAKPKRFWAVAICKDTEHGFAVGDEFFLVPGFTTSSNIGANVFADATNIMCVIGTTGIGSYQKTGAPGGSATFTPAKWRIILRADP